MLDIHKWIMTIENKKMFAFYTFLVIYLCLLIKQVGLKLLDNCVCLLFTLRNKENRKSDI